MQLDDVQVGRMYTYVMW